MSPAAEKCHLCWVLDLLPPFLLCHIEHLSYFPSLGLFSLVLVVLPQLCPFHQLQPHVCGEHPAGFNLDIRT